MAALNKLNFDATAPEHLAGKLSNFFASGDYQTYLSAINEWVTNIVFLKSGTTARQEEKNSALVDFWPQSDDKPETVYNKTVLRIKQEINVHLLAGMEGRQRREISDRTIERLERQLATVKERGVIDIDVSTIEDIFDALKRNISIPGINNDKSEKSEFDESEKPKYKVIYQ